ncbi:MAG: CocE/NonD family hydrolase [Myxococcales bacterium]|nr:CocE/NonD family hydrolase [Myxococcales bacterium]
MVRRRILYAVIAALLLPPLTLALLLPFVRRRFTARVLGLPPPRSGTRTLRRIAVPTADGLRLYAALFEPDRPGAYPTLIIRTPYGLTVKLAWFARRFAERGYRVVAQECRGCARSDGVFDPAIHEAADGLATIEWIRSQRWYDREAGLAMLGGSYLGYVQWAVAAEAPAELRALAPSITSSDFRASFWRGGALALQVMTEWMIMTEDDSGVPSLRLRASRPARALPWRHLPLRTLDEQILGRRVDHFREWISRPERSDPYWSARSHDERIAELTAAVQISTRWHDLFLVEALDDYRRLVDAGRAPILHIGPGGHTDLSATLHGVRDDLAFLGHVFAGASLPWPTPVRVYLTGAREWLHLSEWPPPARRERLSLTADRRLVHGTSRGPADPHIGWFRYDPEDPTPSLGGALLRGAPVVDNRALEARADVLVYTSAPLDGDVDVVGQLALHLRVRTSERCGQLVVRVCEVDRRGVSRNVCDGIQTFSGTREQTHSITILLGPTGHRFRAGHRLRLQIAGGAFPRFARNPGYAVAVASARRLLPVEYTLIASAADDCALELPVFDRA